MNNFETRIYLLEKHWHAGIRWSSFILSILLVLANISDFIVYRRCWLTSHSTRHHTDSSLESYWGICLGRCDRGDSNETGYSFVEQTSFPHALYPGPHYPSNTALWSAVLTLWKGGMISPSFLKTTRAVAGNNVCLIVGTSLGSLNNHLHSFSWLFGYDQFLFSLEEKPKHSRFLMFQLAHKIYSRIRRLSFVFIDMNCPHIWLVSKVLMHNSLDRLPWNFELLSNVVEFLGFWSVILYRIVVLY